MDIELVVPGAVIMANKQLIQHTSLSHLIGQIATIVSIDDYATILRWDDETFNLQHLTRWSQVDIWFDIASPEEVIKSREKTQRIKWAMQYL